TFRTWTFANGRYSAIGKEKQEVGDYRLNPAKSPKHLDLITTFEKKPITIMCIYALDRDTLRIGFTDAFIPGTPEQEERRLRDMAATRPKQFDESGHEIYTVSALTLKRKAVP